jgi:hypothetical protein
MRAQRKAPFSLEAIQRIDQITDRFTEFRKIDAGSEPDQIVFI